MLPFMSVFTYAKLFTSLGDIQEQVALGEVWACTSRLVWSILYIGGGGLRDMEIALCCIVGSQRGL